MGHKQHLIELKIEHFTSLFKLQSSLTMTIFIRMKLRYEVYLEGKQDIRRANLKFKQRLDEELSLVEKRRDDEGVLMWTKVPNMLEDTRGEYLSDNF